MANKRDEDSMAVVEIGGNHWLVTFDSAVALAKGLCNATQLEREWSNNSYKPKKPDAHRIDINIKLLDVVELAKIALNDD